MYISHTIYCELPGDIDLVRRALCRPDLWQELPSGALRAGTLWRWGDELYRVALRQSANNITLEAIPVVGKNRRLQIATTLRDATVSTHATFEITLQLAAPPWARRRLRRALEQRAAMCIAVLQRAIARSNLFQLQSFDKPTSNDLVESLRDRYPNTVAAFETMNALDHLERVHRLEGGWNHIAAGAFDESFYTSSSQQKAFNPSPIAHRPSPQYDLIYAGGGLGLLHAAVMAKKGWRVLLFDRGEVGCAHREWNISRKELAALVDLGLVTWDDLESIVMREYRTGLVRFHADQHASDQNDLWLPGVLDVALDAGTLLRLMRQKLLASGGTILDYRTFKRVVVHQDATHQVEVELQHESVSESYRARLLLDGMGSTSPLALLRHQGHPFAGVCPTVGTVAEGFIPGSDDPRHHDPTLGDILISVQDAQRGQQYMWEGFPGRGDELTVYLFYYDTVGFNDKVTRWQGGTVKNTQSPSHPVTQSPGHSLLALFEDYFTLLPSYKEPGPEFRHVKPVYGYIPARHSLRRQEAPLLRGVLPVGDSAAQQSPLTFCGFGSHVRNLARTTGLLDYALQHDLIAPDDLRSISAFQANVLLNWVFSRFMHPWGQPDDVNALQNIFLGVLNDLGGELATRFFQDRMHWSDYHKMVLGMFWRFPPIVGIAWRVLGLSGCRQWISDYLQFSREALLARLGRLAGRSGERFAGWLLDRIAPRRALMLRSRYAEWRAMGWVD